MHRISLEEEIYEINKYNINTRPILREIHTADIHFGVNGIDPKLQYDILEEQFYSKLDNMEFDIISINGDLFDHKGMTNSSMTTYAAMSVSRIVNICKKKNNRPTFVILDGTDSHDAGQLSLFYHYLKDPDIDIRIVRKLQFEYIKGAKILCIPEMYNMGEEYYNHFLKHSGLYDGVFMHGMIKGAVHQQGSDGLNTYKAPTFSIQDFNNCLGPIISGHVHIPGCFNKYMYYSGSPLRFRHGEEEEKGFLILLHNLNDQSHYVHFEPIKSFVYKTIYLDDIINQELKLISDFILDMKNKDIYNLRIKFNKPLSDIELNNLGLLKSYFRNRGDINFDYSSKEKLEEQKMMEELNNKHSKYDFIFDDKLTPEQIFIMYVNTNEESEFITLEEFQNILDDKF